MTEQEPPDLVRGTYTNDLNINKIHEAILLRFEIFLKNVPKYKEQLERLILVSLNELKPENEIKIINKEIKKLQTIVNDYENKASYNKYISSTSKLLEEYNKVASNTSKGVVFFKKQLEKEDEAIINHRLYIIREYIDIAKQYIRLEISHKIPSKSSCGSCGIDMSKNLIDEDLGLIICPKCGYERENISYNSTYKDIQRVNLSNRNNYDDCENFRKALLRFQGRQNHRPPSKLYEQLDDYFIKIKKPTGKEILNTPSTEDGKKKGTSREMMFEALSETNNSAYYDDINLILHIYWGWDLPDISSIEERIMEDYINTQHIYNSIVQKDRNASLNIQFRLYVHLKAVGYPCTKDDFKIQTSRDSLIFHNEMWNIMCEKTGIKFHPVI
jgi:hypothetical protein